MERRPELVQEYEPYLEAFWELGTDRYLGPAGFGPIPGSRIDSYSREFGFDRTEFRYVIRSMDLAYLRHMNKK